MLLSSVAGRLALLVLAVAVPGAVLVGLLTKRAYDAERAAVAKHLMTSTRAVATLAERKFDAGEALVRGLASYPALHAGDLPAFETRARQVLENPDDWIVLIDANGEQRINTRVPLGGELPKVILPAEFLATLKTGSRYVSDVLFGPVVAGPVLTVTIPVLLDGKLAYGITLAMTPAALARAVAIRELTKTQIVVILDRQGVVAARSRGAERFVGKPATPDLVAATASAPEGIIESRTLEGISTVTAFARCPTIGWTAAIGVPRAELNESAHQVLRLTLVWTFLMVMVAATLAWWIGRALVRGFADLVASTQHLARGEIPASVPSPLQEIDRVSLAVQKAARELSVRDRELKRLNDELETRVAVRTRELDQANTALRSANRELEDFARVAAHDLREPLRSMTAFTDVLREEHRQQLDETGRGYLDRVSRAAGRLSALLEAILAYSKTSTAPLGAFERVDLNHTLAAVQQDLTARIVQTGGRVEAAALPEVRGDAKQLHQLMMNLVGNALKFHRPGVPPVVSLKSVAADGWVTLWVTDNGIGFDPAAVERVFAPFERLHREYDGSGIGLAIVRRIAERHGGSVQATSQPGVGSTFIVRLPTSDTAAD